MSFTGLREILVVGPSDPDGQPIYQLVCYTVYTDPAGIERSVDRMPALRSLGINPQPDNTVSVKIPGIAGEAMVDFVAPSLLRGRVDLGTPRGIAPKLTGPGTVMNKDKDAVSHDHDPGVGVKDLILAPRDIWPTKTKPEQIYVPAMRLVAGELDLRLKSPMGLARFASFLRYDLDNHTVLGGLRLFEQSEATEKYGPAIRLVPEGVEIEVWVPNPVHAMRGHGDLVFPARLRIEPWRAGLFRARIVGPAKDESAEQLKDRVSVLKGVFDEIAKSGAPLRIEFDSALQVPPYLWHLQLVNEKLTFEGGAAYKWRASLDSQRITLRSETDYGPNSGQQAVARFNLDAPTVELTLSQADDENVTLDCVIGKDQASQVTVDYTQQLDTSVFERTGFSANVGAYLPLADALRQERALRSRDEPLPEQDNDVFLMLSESTLQLSSQAGTPRKEEPDGATSAFEGGLTFTFENCTVEIDRAPSVALALRWKAQKPALVQFRIGAPTGGLRRALWIALESPTPARLLPTGRRDPAASREIVAVIGGLQKPSFALEMSQAMPGRLAWKLKAKTDATAPATAAVHWAASQSLPLVTVMPMLALYSEGPEPSDVRGLVPAGIDVHTVWTLASNGTPGLPRLDVAGNIASEIFQWPWPDTGDGSANWGLLSVPLVNPLAPGVEYSFDPLSADVKHLALRYDLPILDEFFAGLSADDVPDPEKPATKDAETTLGEPGSLPFETRVHGVLSSTAMHRLWEEQSIKLGLARTQMARATGWTAGPDTRVQGPENLVRGHGAAASVGFPMGYILKGFCEPLPLGGYDIDWPGPGGVEHYSGEAALAGLSGRFTFRPDGRLTRADKDGSLRIAGFATALYTRANGLPTDANQTGFGADAVPVASADPAGRNRDASVLGAGETIAAQIALHTLEEPVCVTGFDEGPLSFWVRDLPLVGDTFEASASPLEGALGPSPEPFEPGAAALSLYEWRLGANRTGGTPGFSFTKDILRYWPLRLMKYRPSKVLHVLCRLDLTPKPDDDLTPKPDNESMGHTRFSDDKPYTHGPLVEVQFEWRDGVFKLNQIIAKVLVPEATGLELENAENAQKVRFPLQLTLNTRLGQASHTAEGKIPATLSGTLSADGDLRGAALDFRVLGRSVSLQFETPSDSSRFRFTADAPPPAFGLHLQGATLDLKKKTLEVQLSGAVPIDKRSDAPPALRIGKEAEPESVDVRWLGVGSIKILELSINHERGSLQLTGDAAVGRTDHPIAGLSVADGTLTLRAVLILSTPNDVPDFSFDGALDSGFVSARFEGNPNSEIVLSSTTEIAPPGDPNRMRVKTDIWLDRKASGTASRSGVSWDPEAVRAIEPSHVDPSEPGSVIVTIKGSEDARCYTHEVNATLKGHEIPSSHLRIREPHDGEAVGIVQLAKEVPLVLFVQHELKRNEETVLKWAALEPVVLSQSRLWMEGYAPSELWNPWEFPRVFGPRYRYRNPAPTYRGEQPSDSGIVISGVGTRREMLGGFDDRAIWDTAKPTDNDPLVLIGGGAGIADLTDKAVLFGLPWVISFGGVNLPDPFDGLMKFGGSERRWRAARFDATVTQMALKLLEPTTNVPAGTIEGPAIRRLLEAGAVIREGESLSGMARMVEQSFVEPEKDEDLDDSVNTPIFLHSLIALRDVLKVAAGPGELPVITLHPLRLIDSKSRQNRLARIVVCRALWSSENPAPRATLPSYRLRALRRGGGVAERVLDTSWMDAQDGSKVEISSVRNHFGAPLLRKLAESMIEDPDAALLMKIVGDARTTDVEGVELAPRLQEFGRNLTEADAPVFLSDPSQEVYASPALGWPEFYRNFRPNVAGLALHADADEPVMAHRAGLSARSATFALDAPAAAPENSTEARYVATQARALFHHGGSARDTVLPGAPARHLQILPPRVRTPLYDARARALVEAGALEPTPGEGRKPNKIPPELRETLGLLPLGYSRSLIGERPGAFETMIDGVLQDGVLPDMEEGPTPLNYSAAIFGRSATIAPVVMRQMRIPRSPALPVGEVVDGRDEATDIYVRRRTYVSLCDRSDMGAPDEFPRRDPLLTHLVRPVPASFWRYGAEGHIRIVLDLLTETLEAGAMEKELAAGRGLEIAFDARILDASDKPVSQSAALDVLTGSGLLPEHGTQSMDTLDIWLTIGPRRYPARELVLGRASGVTHARKVSRHEGHECVVPLAAVFPVEMTVDLIEELNAPDPDETAMIHFSMRGRQSAELWPDVTDPLTFPISQEDAKLVSGLPRVISLKLNRAPRWRLAQTVVTTSYLFADPAFDRVLTTPAGQSNLVSVSGSKWLLALDRVQYDSGGTMFLSFGPIDEETGHFRDDATFFCNLEFRVTLPGENESQQQLTLDPKANNVYRSKPNKAYAIPVSRLLIKNALKQPIPPGSKIEIAVSVAKVGQNYSLIYAFTLATELKAPAPAAVYSVLRLDDSFKDGAVPGGPRIVLHRSAPTPTRTDFPDLLTDLAEGSVRRRAIFEWSARDIAAEGSRTLSFLVKTDRSGGAQLPVFDTDFQLLTRNDDS